LSGGVGAALADVGVLFPSIRATSPWLLHFPGDFARMNRRAGPILRLIFC